MPLTALAEIRDRLWLEHIAEAADEHGVWESTPTARAKLPTAHALSDGHRHRVLHQMVKKGMLCHIGHAKFKAVKTG